MTDINAKYISHDYSEFEDDYGNVPDDWEGKYGLLLGTTILAIYNDVETGFAELMRIKKETGNLFGKNSELYQLINLSTGHTVVPFLEKEIEESHLFIDREELEKPFRGCHCLYNIIREVSISTSPMMFTMSGDPKGILIGIKEFMEYMKWKSEQTFTSSYEKERMIYYFSIYELLKKYEKEKNKN